MDDQRIVQQLHTINQKIERLTRAMEKIVEMVVEEREDRVSGDWRPSAYEYGNGDSDD